MKNNKYKENIIFWKNKYKKFFYFNIFFLKKYILKYKNIKNIIINIKKKKFNNYIKLLSDYQNQYKRFQKEKIDILKYSNKELILSVLPIVDDFKRSFLFLKKKKNIYLGIHLIYKKLLMILKNYGLKKSNTKIGDKYDYSKHEVIDRIKKKKKNIVLEIIENGYYLNNSLIRYDKVIISF